MLPPRNLAVLCGDVLVRDAAAETKGRAGASQIISLTVEFLATADKVLDLGDEALT